MSRYLVGYCGVYCLGCPIYISSTTADEMVKSRLAAELSKSQDRLRSKSRQRKKTAKIDADSIHCWGCRSNTRHSWKKSCLFKKCASDKGLDFCYHCSEYPCVELARFYAKRPDARENSTIISKIGLEAFMSRISSNSSANKQGIDGLL